MESKIARALDLRFAPVAISVMDERPEQAVSFAPGRWGCIMFLFASAIKGKIAAISAQTYGCWGGGVGMGFGDCYRRFPGGVDCFTRFLSSGNHDWDQGRAVGEALEEKAGKAFATQFLDGEGYVRDPELVEQWLAELPIIDIGDRFVVFRPLGLVGAEETPDTVVLAVNPDQLSALVVLANYARPGVENVCIPWAAGCQAIGILPWQEARSARPRAVVGLTDLSARKYVRPQLGSNSLSFAMPWSLYQEMERHVEGSFLERSTWKGLLTDKARA